MYVCVYRAGPEKKAYVKLAHQQNEPNLGAIELNRNWIEPIEPVINSDCTSAENGKIGKNWLVSQLNASSPKH